MWLDNPENSTLENGPTAEVVSVYFLDRELEDSLYFVGEVPYTSTFLTAGEEIAFTETTMVRERFRDIWFFLEARVSPPIRTHSPVGVSAAHVRQ